MAATDGLWGGQLLAVRFDAVTHRCELQVATTTFGSTIEYAIRCDSVVEMHFQNAITEPWDYAEVTEADLSVDEESGLATLELMLWSEDASLVIRAAAIQILQDN
jgi:hypothetical protein